jgi:hypothetical protein
MRVVVARREGPPAFGVDLNAGAVVGSFVSPNPQAHAGFGGSLSIAPSGQLLVGEPGRDRDGKSDVGAAHRESCCRRRAVG